jgi:hypothetical protein
VSDLDPLGETLRRLGATTHSRPDGYAFELAGVTATYLLGEEIDDDVAGPFTVCTVPLHTSALHFLMDLRPQSVDEVRAVARGDALDLTIGDDPFDRAFVIEAAPSNVVAALLEDTVRARLLALAPCRLTCTGDRVRLIKWGNCARPRVVERIVLACFGFRDAVQRLPETLARRQQPAGYRGGSPIARPEDVDRAAREIAEIEQIRRTRRQIRSAKAGVVFMALAMLAAAYAWCSHV